MDGPGLGDELLLALRIVWVRNATVHGTDGGTLLLVEEPDTFGALLRHDVVDVLAQGGVGLAVILPHAATLVDGRVRALRLAGAAVDALLGDHRGHGRGNLQRCPSDDNLRALRQTDGPAAGAWGP